MADPPWAGTVGVPVVLDCWHYADVGGRQESLTLTFAYGDKQHALSVLIDHGRGGKIKDTWVAKGTGLRADTEQAAWGNPLVVFEVIDAADARLRLERAMAAGECPEQPDQVDDVVAHRALLRARLDLLAGRAAPYARLAEERADQREHQVGPSHDAHVRGAGQHRQLRAGGSARASPPHARGG